MIKHILKLTWNKKGSNSLMILEIFLSFLVLFVVVGYVLFNLNIIKKPLGFATEDRWMISLDRQVDRQDSLERVTTLQNLKAELLAMQEVKDVTFLQSITPFSDNSWRNGFTTGQTTINSCMMPVDFSYASLMDVEISEGRWFTESDLSGTHTPMVVNKLWLDEFGGESVMDSVFTSDGTSYKVVGMVDHNRYRGQFSEPITTMYFANHFYENADNIILQMQPDTEAAVEEKISKLINAVTKTTGNVISTLDQRKEENSRHNWILMIGLLSICGFLCVNVALGLFGVLWYNINKRRAEIGLRQAIGAHGGDITKQFILEILVLTGLAVGLGIFFAVQIPLLGVTEYPASLFYRAIAWATVIILVLVFICALFPSLQAARISPATALHED